MASDSYYVMVLAKNAKTIDLCINWQPFNDESIVEIVDHYNDHVRKKGVAIREYNQAHNSQEELCEIIISNYNLYSFNEVKKETDLPEFAGSVLLDESLSKQCDDIIPIGMTNVKLSIEDRCLDRIQEYCNSRKFYITRTLLIIRNGNVYKSIARKKIHQIEKLKIFIDDPIKNKKDLYEHFERWGTYILDARFNMRLGSEPRIKEGILNYFLVENEGG